jgi:hypothetical protein
LFQVNYPYISSIKFIKNNAYYNLNLRNGITFSLSRSFYLYFSNRLNFSENLKDLTEEYYEVGFKIYKDNLLETTIFYENFQSDKTQTNNNSIGGRVFIDTPFLFHSRLTGFIRDGIYSIYPKRKLECKFGIDKHFKKQNLNFSADLIYHYLGGIHYEPSKFLDPNLPQNENLKHSHSFDFEGRLSISSLNLFFIYENLFNNQILIQNHYFPQKPRSIKWGIMWSFIN